MTPIPRELPAEPYTCRKCGHRGWYDYLGLCFPCVQNQAALYETYVQTDHVMWLCDNAKGEDIWTPENFDAMVAHFGLKQEDNLLGMTVELIRMLMVD